MKPGECRPLVECFRADDEGALLELTLCAFDFSQHKEV